MKTYDNIFTAIRFGDLAQVQAFITATPALLDRFHGNYNPLLTACFRYQAAILAYLLAQGANPNAITTNGHNGLMYVCSSNDQEKSFNLATQLHMAQALIDAQIDLNQTSTSNGRTALHIAASFGNKDMIALLLDAGAAPVKDVRGKFFYDLCSAGIKQWLQAEYPYVLEGSEFFFLENQKSTLIYTKNEGDPMKTLKLFEQFNGIEDKPRLPEAIVKLLNEQIKNELDSSQLYRAISCWCDDQGLIKASKYYFTAANEELTHMNKIYEYLFDKNCKAITPVCNEAKDAYKDITEVVQSSLEHEIQITENWNQIANTALKEKDNDTYCLSQWFLKEQIEEENKFRDFLFNIRLEMPKWKIEELFG